MNNSFRFEVSLSNDAFVNKEISDAMIGATNHQTADIRKKYGFKGNVGVGYARTSVTSSDLFDELTSGKVMCHLFTPKKLRIDGSFSSSEKKDENFEGSYVIGVDIDDTKYTSMKEYISTLSIQPTFGYTTYSNGFKGVRFRLMYVFNEEITGKYYFRYAAWSLYNIIERDTKEEIEDKCGLRASQYFNGTNKNNPDLLYDDYFSGNIYSLNDINVTPNGYVDFLKNNCFYKTTANNKEIKDILLSYTNQYQTLPTTINVILENPTTPDNDEFDERLLCDWDRLATDDFVRQKDWIELQNSTQYYFRISKGQWVFNKFQETDKDYFALFYNTHKVADGNKRRRDLFMRMCLRRIINQNITLKEMVYNTLVDIITQYDNSDKVLNADFIKRNVTNCFELTVEEIQERYAGEIEYLKKATAPKKGLIYKNRGCHSSETTYQIIDTLYDPSISFGENLESINKTYKIKKSTLYNYLKNRNMKSDGRRLSNAEIMSLIDFSKSANSNYKFIKSLGYKIDNKRINKLIKEYNNTDHQPTPSTTINVILENPTTLDTLVYDENSWAKVSENKDNYIEPDWNFDRSNFTIDIPADFQIAI